MGVAVTTKTKKAKWHGATVMKMLKSNPTSDKEETRTY